VRPNRGAQECETFFQGKERLLLNIISDGHDHFVEQLGRALDYVQMSVSDGIEAARIDGSSHGLENVQRSTRLRKLRRGGRSLISPQLR
jgi:hypothetical protein